MKKWFKFFSLSFFSDKISKETSRRGYTNVFLGFVLTLAFLLSGFVGGEMLPFGVKYDKAPDFSRVAELTLANSDSDKRITVEIRDGALVASKGGRDFSQALLVNTIENETDRQSYSAGGYEVVVDTRPADTFAEVEAYCVSNDGQELVITYEEYLTLSTVARLNFDFKLRYTGEALELNREAVEAYCTYLKALNADSKLRLEAIDKELADGNISDEEYNRDVYLLYFESYYPEISEYESSSKAPLLRNYYYHEYISKGESKYLFIFDDYMACSFETEGGECISFYGFYTGLEDGAVIPDGVDGEEARVAVDSFIKDSFRAVLPLTLYAYAMNIFALIPFIALMPLVVTLLAYSIMKLCGIESVRSFGDMFKIIGSYIWFSGLISVVLTLIMSFIVPRSIVAALPTALFFTALAIRSVIFSVNEIRSYKRLYEETASEEV